MHLSCKSIKKRLLCCITESWNKLRFILNLPWSICCLLSFNVVSPYQTIFRAKLFNLVQFSFFHLFICCGRKCCIYFIVSFKKFVFQSKPSSLIYKLIKFYTVYPIKLKFHMWFQWNVYTCVRTIVVKRKKNEKIKCTAAHKYGCFEKSWKRMRFINNCFIHFTNAITSSTYQIHRAQFFIWSFSILA